jgi:hypothetical protein
MTLKEEIWKTTFKHNLAPLSRELLRLNTRLEEDPITARGIEDFLADVTKASSIATGIVARLES